MRFRQHPPSGGFECIAKEVTVMLKLACDKKNATLALPIAALSAIRCLNLE
jgi:hypothetical protein